MIVQLVDIAISWDSENEQTARTQARIFCDNNKQSSLLVINGRLDRMVRYRKPKGLIPLWQIIQDTITLHGWFKLSIQDKFAYLQAWSDTYGLSLVKIHKLVRYELHLQLKG